MTIDIRATNLTAVAITALQSGAAAFETFISANLAATIIRVSGGMKRDVAIQLVESAANNAKVSERTTFRWLREFRDSLNLMARKEHSETRAIIAASEETHAQQIALKWWLETVKAVGIPPARTLKSILDSADKAIKKYEESNRLSFADKADILRLVINNTTPSDFRALRDMLNAAVIAAFPDSDEAKADATAKAEQEAKAKAEQEAEVLRKAEEILAARKASEAEAARLADIREAKIEARKVKNNAKVNAAALAETPEEAIAILDRAA